MPGGKLGHAVPNGGRGPSWNKGGGAQREMERAQGRRSMRLRHLDNPEPPPNGTSSGEPSPVYRDRRALSRRGRQLMDRNIRASWRSLKNDGTMALVSLSMVVMMAFLATSVDLRSSLAGLLALLPIGPKRSQELLEGALSWRTLELGCWWSSALLLTFFTWLLYAALFDMIGMLLGTFPSVLAGLTVFAARIAPAICPLAPTASLREGAPPTMVVPGGATTTTALCGLPWVDSPAVMLGGTLVVAATTGGLSALVMFALRQRLPGPDQSLALLSTATSAVITVTVCSAPESWEVVQMAAQWLASLEDPTTAAQGWRSLAHLETGLWTAGAILLAFFSWLLFAALYDVAGMVTGVVPSFAAACCVVALRVLPAACRAEPQLTRRLHPHLCEEGERGSRIDMLPAVSTTLLLMLGSCFLARWIHNTWQKKVLVVHGPAAIASPSAGAPRR